MEKNWLCCYRIKFESIYSQFDSFSFIQSIEQGVPGKSYTERVNYFAQQLKHYLPDDYIKSINLLVAILGEENPYETGMFTNYYWIMPIGKFVEHYGLAHFDVSIKAIEEITKRNTGEYAIRPFIRSNPDRCLDIIKNWATSENFHLRRLASEGLRPKLPWAPKLDTFDENPQPVFEILELLKEDEVMFVKKSVGNHLTDWLKVNYEPTKQLILEWINSDNPHTQWIIKRATRKIKVN